MTDTATGRTWLCCRTGSEPLSAHTASTPLEICRRWATARGWRGWIDHCRIDHTATWAGLIDGLDGYDRTRVLLAEIDTPVLWLEWRPDTTTEIEAEIEALARDRRGALVELRRVHRWLTEAPDGTAPPTTADVAAMVAARIDLLDAS